MKTIDWNQMSKLGLIEKINREILHPLGLAMTRNPDNGCSESILISDDGVWEYAKEISNKRLTKEEIETILRTKNW